MRALDFNHSKKQLLASGSVNGEVCSFFHLLLRVIELCLNHLSHPAFKIYIWDMTSLKPGTEPYGTGQNTPKPGDITSLAWNHETPQILASSLSSGYTIIWDVRKRKHVKTLSYGGAGSTGGMSGLGFGGSLTGGRAAMSSVLWSPKDVSFIGHCSFFGIGLLLWIYPVSFSPCRLSPLPMMMPLLL